jgi:hypothetical protein
MTIERVEDGDGRLNCLVDAEQILNTVIDEEDRSARIQAQWNLRRMVRSTTFEYLHSTREAMDVIDSRFEDPDVNRSLRRYAHKLFRNEADIRARAGLRQLERKTGPGPAPSRPLGRL